MSDIEKVEKQEPSTKLILIVDDDEALLDYVIALLQKEGFRTKSAMDGKIAVKRIKEEKVDLVLLDMMMPNASGFEVIKQFQADNEIKETPVFLVTARKVDRSTWDMIRQEPNVKDIIQKPINPFDFKKKIHAVLNTLSPQDKIDKNAKQQLEQERKSPADWQLPPAFRKKKDDI